MIKLIQVIIIAQQIAQGMGYLHHKGIIHKVPLDEIIIKMMIIIMITIVMIIMILMIVMHQDLTQETDFPAESLLVGRT